MRKKHPIRQIVIILLLAALAAGLAALPMLTAGKDGEEKEASILSGLPQRQDLTVCLHSGAPLSAGEPSAVTIPQGVYVTSYLVANGDSVKAGDPIARLDDVSLMSAVTQVQAVLDTTADSLRSVRNKIDPGVLTVDGSGNLCIDGKQIQDSKLTDYTQFLTLSAQYREYEQLLQELFRLRQSGVVTAPCDGMIGEVEDAQILQLSNADGARLVFLSDMEEETTADETQEPTEESTEATEPPAGTAYAYTVLKIKRIADPSTWEVWEGDSGTLSDLSDFSGISREVDESAEAFLFTPGVSTIATPTGSKTAEAGDVVLCVRESEAQAWSMYVWLSSAAPEEPTEPGTGETDPTQAPPERPGGAGGAGGIDWSKLPSGSRGGFDSSGADQSENLYSTASVQLCTVTPMDTMSLTLSIDEMDISRLAPGMTAQITLEALPNRQFTAQITEISSFGTNSGGSSKFDVTLELPWEEDMLPGMNANVTIPLETLPDCLTVPVAALTEQGNRTVIYTGFDEETGQMNTPVPVELGYSDGQNVQLLSGLDEGTAFWYAYYDTLEISTAVETIGMFG